MEGGPQVNSQKGLASHFFSGTFKYVENGHE